jgi:hypothetical protein
MDGALREHQQSNALHDTFSATRGQDKTSEKTKEELSKA